ncbi:DUF624 domain-containing protein [Catellatospora bangladeshensis]|uniref:DUF624 domain-containing protein n=1 Tax=Catellatospora bangladeshensis TaxID=310355 RepID=A0A8J3JSE5_9ACTN|nr:DUF624 domain-containing protein [Catellatospora bangladeshensis]GIF82329.1 hypothetical protein Cba03nite_36780 [Catellatospora bangladeshensis]
MRLLARLPYETVFNTVYAGLKVNLCLVAATLPLLLAFAASPEPLAAWPFFTALAVICGPAAAGAFGAFAAFGEGEHRIGRAFWAAYRASFGHALAAAAVAAALVIVLAVDFRLALGGPFAAATPVLALLIALVVAATTVLLATGARWRPRTLLSCAYLALRGWHLSLVNLAVLGTLTAAVAVKPAIGLFLLPAPVLYVVWANVRHLAALRPSTATGRAVA